MGTYRRRCRGQSPAEQNDWCRTERVSGQPRVLALRSRAWPRTCALQELTLRIAPLPSASRAPDRVRLGVAEVEESGVRVGLWGWGRGGSGEQGGAHVTQGELAAATPHRGHREGKARVWHARWRPSGPGPDAAQPFLAAAFPVALASGPGA